MTLLGWSRGLSDREARLAAAAENNAAAQASARLASEETADAAHKASRRAVFMRRRARLATSRLKSTPMQTGSVRELVDEMLNGPCPQEKDAGR